MIDHGEPVEGVTICPNCHAPAEYLDTRSVMEAVCGRCARRDSAFDSGGVHAAAVVLNTAAKIAADVGFTLEDALEAVRDGYGQTYDLPDIDSHKPRWAMGFFEHDTRFVPLNQPTDA